MSGTKEEDVFATLNNCWRAMCRRMRENPTGDMQTAMNLLARIITETERVTRERKHQANRQISIEEWMAWFAKHEKEEI